MNEPYRYSAPIVVPPSEDERHLKMLSVFHYVWAGFVGLLALIPGLYIALGAFAASMPPTPAMPGGRHGAAEGQVMGDIFIAIGVIGVLLCAATATMLVMAGKALAARRRTTLILVSACIICMWVPVGTVLGVFTLVLMQRPGVKALFNAGMGAQAAAVPGYPPAPYPPR